MPALLNRDFALVWLGGLVSLTGDWVLVAGLPLVVYQLTGSTLALGATAMAGAIPRLLAGSIAGVFVDRWDRRRAMLVADLLLALGLLPLFFVTSAEHLWLVILVGVFESTVVQFYRPAEAALLPNLVPDEQLVRANALNGLNGNVARLVGPPIGALLVSLSGLAGVIVVDAASFLLAAVLLVFVHAGSRQPKQVSRDVPSVWREWLAGLRLIKTHRTPRIIFAFLALTGLGEGVMTTLFIPFATRIMHGSELTYASLLSAQAAGGIIGGIMLSRVGVRFVPSLLLGVGAVVLGLIDMCIFFSPLVTPQMAVPVLLMGLVGFPVAAMQTGYLTLAQTSVDDAFRGRLLGLFFATLALSGVIGIAVGGALGDVVGILPLLTVQCAVYLAGGLMVLATLWRGERISCPRKS